MINALRCISFWSRKKLTFSCTVQGVFIIHEPCHIQEVEGLEIHLLFMALMRDKDLLHIINEKQIFLVDH